METLEELQDRDALCQYCPLPEESQGIHCYGGAPVMCERCCCGEAYQRYLEEEIDE